MLLCISLNFGRKARRIEILINHTRICQNSLKPRSFARKVHIPQPVLPRNVGVAVKHVSQFGLIISRHLQCVVHSLAGKTRLGHNAIIAVITSAHILRASNKNLHI